MIKKTPIFPNEISKLTSSVNAILYQLLFEVLVIHLKFVYAGL